MELEGGGQAVTPQRVAPKLDGYQVSRLLGSGGFADVYLYQQDLPRRDVAIKVLHDGVSANAARVFTQEANVMAQLSAHPTIVTIFDAGVASDGRPFIVMEYYPNANLSIRYRAKPFRVDEALDITIRLAGAVETAHRAGIIHRDIKPANVLMSAYGKPGLTDFGIAAAKVDMEGSEAGLSIPWSPAEVVNDPNAADERSDVYSLAATAYTLLAGHSPYEVPGQRNTPLDLVGRIASGRVPQLDRSDVPSGLRSALSIAMDSDPARRPSSAEEFARMLQEVEIGLHLPVTSLDLLTSGATVADDEEDADVTRLRGARVVRPQGPDAESRPMISGVPEQSASRFAPPARTAAAAPAAKPPTSLEFEAQHTIIRSNRDSAAQSPDDTGSQAPGGGGRVWLIGAGVAVVAAAGVLAATLLAGGDASPAGTEASQEPVPDQDAFVLSVPSPTDLTITRTSDTTARATWQSPDPQPGDSFQWQRTDPGAEPARGLSDTQVLEMANVTAAVRPCLNVWLVRQGIASEQPASTCMS